MNCVRCY